MYLSELTIVGFKSFAKKVNVVFHDGITGIVGPNGCGKSNVVDAIRWVMGEQRSGVLRSERMENVIFNGSASAKPVGMAEVSLRLENTKNLLPVDYTEVQITRRLFRSGESQYLINGNQVRLKDILDLFMDTGLGPGTYSVIELPQVERILNGKDDERRKIFEEAAGITKYKLRLKATFRKLEATEKDLLRIEDIMSEVEKSVRSLRRQVSRAERYQEMTRELKEIEIKLATFEYTRIIGELEPLATKLGLVQDEREQASGALALADADYEAKRARLLDLERQIAEEQKVNNILEKEIQKYDERILVNKERLRSLEENRSRYGVEEKTFGARLSALTSDLQEAELKNTKAEKRLEEKRSEYELRNTAFQEIKSRYDDSRRQAKEMEIEILRITEEVSRKQNEGERLKANEENLSSRLAELDTEERQYEERYRDLVGRLTQVRDQEQRTAQQLEEKRKKFTRKREDEQENRRSFEGLQKAYLQDQNRAEVLKNQAALVRRLIENYEDYPAGVRHLATMRDGGYSTYGPIANILRIQPEYGTAIAAALSEAATFLVVDNAERAYQGIELLKQDKKGVVSFLPIQQIQNRPRASIDLDDLGIVGWADELVEYNQVYRPVVQAVLGNFLVVQDLQTAQRLFKNLQREQINVVTLAGELFSSWGMIRGGSHNKRQSEFIGRQEQLLALEREIEEIEKLCEKRRRSMSELEENAQAAKIDAEELENAIRELEKELGSIRVDLGRLNYEDQSLTEAREKRRNERERLIAELSRVDQVLQEQSFNAEDLQIRRQKLGEQSQIIADQVRSLEKEVAEFGEQVQTVNVEVARLQSQYDALRRERESLARQVSETGSMIESRKEEAVRAAEEAAELSELNQEYGRLVKENQDRLKIVQEKLDKLEEEEHQVNTALAEKEKLIRAGRGKAEDLANTVHAYELRFSELKLVSENLKTRIRDEYHVELEIQKQAEELDVESMRERVEAARERIESYGPVNLLALKEYEQENERLEFLLGQKNDLISARKDLTDTINIINATARQKFLETFEEIQKNFAQVFRNFFEGGRASLVLREEKDPLESDIDIYATPGGKRLSALTLLSGGEKSLTAISLLFAIYLVKPSPLCIFDEVDAPLDDQNVKRFTTALERFSDNTQFIVVTHNKLTMRAADQLYGVTTEEEGVSKIVSVRFEKDQEELAEQTPVSV
ncbi:chromosome segregation protein SMC [candidate division KSB1 bacterium]|nr:chromosome segregation protein SMC [candidate division KSB1 bacterium]